MELEQWYSSYGGIFLKPPSDDYVDSLSTAFQSFIGDMHNLQNDPLENKIKALIPQISTLSDGLKLAVDAYLKGHPDVAYLHFKNAISGIERYIDIITDVKINRPQDTRFYRIRTSYAPEKFTRQQLYHIPFELRHRVSLQRFSIPGLPCLYLGGSLFVCWEELNRPAFSSIYAAEFRLQPGKGKFLNLVGSVNLLRGYIDNFRRGVPTDPVNANLEDVIIAFTVCWPLSVACMTQVKNRDSPFKPEYIIPQLLLQWLTQEKPHLDGIRYLSTKLDYTHSFIISSNYVIPVKSSLRNGLCQSLKDLFTVSQVFGWDAAMASGIRPTTIARNQRVEIAPNYQVAYEETAFGRFETILNEMNFEPL